jgi:hypothetical protein
MKPAPPVTRTRTERPEYQRAVAAPPGRAERSVELLCPALQCTDVPSSLVAIAVDIFKAR